MAKIFIRKWFAKGATGHKIRKVAYGYTLQVPCDPCPHKKKDGGAAHPGGVRQERIFDASWAKEDAEGALAARVLQGEQAEAHAAAARTFGEVAGEYLEYKRGKGKRSIRQDEQIIRKLIARLGSD